MLITIEINLANFDAWSGAKDTLETLKEKGLIDELEQYLEDYFEEIEKPWTKTQLNDFLWFNKDQIADILGYDYWDNLLEDKKRED